MNISQRLAAYKKKHNMTDEALFLALRGASIMVSIGTVKNWLKKNNEPSQMFRVAIENFLTTGDKIERSNKKSSHRGSV